MPGPAPGERTEQARATGRRLVTTGAGPGGAAAARAVATVQIDTPGLRVTEWRFAPGAATGPHRHEYPYVVVPLTTGRLAITAPGGAVTHASLVVGQSYRRDAGVEHDVRNANPFELAFVEIEIKPPAAPGAGGAPCA